MLSNLAIITDLSGLRLGCLALVVLDHQALGYQSRTSVGADGGDGDEASFAIRVCMRRQLLSRSGTFG